ncbi:MAG: hypothetical protein WC846_03905 [Candidatus Gracilibacteria bacterium]|jgi:hypothetical protein
MKKLLIGLVLCLFLTACGTESQPVIQENWVTLNADLADGGDFTLLTPSKWKFEQGVGMDSQVGTISGDGITLQFDYGMYAGNPINDSELGEKLVAQNEVIDGLNAVIVTPKVSGDGVVALYFESTGSAPKTVPVGDESFILDEQHLLLFGENLTAEQEAIVLQIFRTIKFQQ